MPIISNGGNATIAVSANQILTVQVSGGAEFTYENPVGTRVLDSGSNNVFGPFASAGSVKLSSVVGNLFYEVATPPQAIAPFTPAAVAITGGTIAGSVVANGAQVVSSITALRTLLKTSPSNQSIVTGYYVQGDGGGGTYYYDSTDTVSTDNGGSIIVATDGGRWKLIPKITVNPKDAGANGDNTANDGPKLRAAIAIASNGGSEVQFKKATYKVDAVGGACINVTNPIYISGDGGVYTAVNPSLASATDSTLKITPSGAFDYTLMRITGIALHDPSSGTRTGLHGVYCDTTISGNNLAKFNLRDCTIGQGSNALGYGFYHFNSQANNINGGLYCGLFENNSIKGGVRFDGSGDSNSVVHNIITGVGISVQASLVAGASLLEVQANNLTSNGGAFRLDSGPRYRFIGNNCENSAPGALSLNNAAIVNIAGVNGVLYGGVITENLISGFGTTDATIGIRLRNSRGTLIQDNVLLSGNAGLTTGIDIGVDCFDIRIGPNAFDAAVTTQVNDNGVGTMGVIKTAVLQNSWVAFLAGTATLKFIKAIDGLVHLYGSIKGGTIANGTIIATLPTGFRPSEIIRSIIFVNNAGTPQIAELAIDTAGNILISFVLSNNQVDINLTFPALNLANGTSLE